MWGEMIAMLFRVGVTSTTQLAVMKVQSKQALNTQEKLQKGRMEGVKTVFGQEIDIAPETPREVDELKDSKAGEYLRVNAPSLYDSIVEGKIKKAEA